ncbi:MAG: putative Ig domain-containing protein, partial [Verrucomicrobiota bacterium]
RYEFYEYVGPYDDLSEPPTHEALCELPGPDGIHGSGTYSNRAVVGKFLGAQMTAMAGKPPLALIDHLPDGEVNVEFSPRTIVITSDTNFTATADNLPDGLLFDAPKALVYGTPTTLAAGIHIVTVTATASNSPVLVKNYPILIATVPDPVPHSAVDTTASPTIGGLAVGDGVYTNGTSATVIATPNAGYRFVNWTENGAVVATAATYTFTNIVNRSLLATFVPAPTLSVARQPGAFLLAWPTNFSGYTLQQNIALKTTNWTKSAETVSAAGTNYQAVIQTTNGPRLFRLIR